MDELPVLEFGVSGFSGVMARTDGELERVARSARDVMRIKPVRADDQGAITLASVILPAETRVTYQKLEPAFEYGMLFKAPRKPIAVTLQRGITVTIPGSAASTFEFTAPTALSLRSADQTMQLTYRFPQAVQDALPARIEIKGLGLDRVVERPGTESTAVNSVSTVLGGRLTIGSASYQVGFQAATRRSGAQLEDQRERLQRTLTVGRLYQGI